MKKKQGLKVSAGRPTLLTRTLQHRLCKALAEGSTINGACAVCGISSRTYREWIDRGENGEQPYAAMISAVSRARDIAKDNLVRSIIADRDWRARAWYLERCFPDEFGNARVNAPEQKAWPEVIVLHSDPPDSPEVERLRRELPDHYEIHDLDGSIKRIPV